MAQIISFYENTKDDVILCEPNVPMTTFESYTDDLLYHIKEREIIKNKKELLENAKLIEKELQKFENTPAQKFIDLIVAGCVDPSDEDCEISLELTDLVCKYVMGCKVVRNKVPTYEEAVKILEFDKTTYFDPMQY